MSGKRCVITGVGMLCALGNDARSCFDAVKQGVTGIKTVRSISTEGCYAHLGAEVQNAKLPAPECDRAVRLCLSAAQQAADDAHLSGDDLKDAGVLIGSCVGGAASIDAYYTGLNNGAADESMIPRMSASGIAANVAAKLGAHGIASNIVNACAASTMTIAHACRLLRSGTGSVYLAGGTDSFSSLAYAGFLALHALSEDICSPFNHSNGISIGEGSAVLVVEDYDHAIARGAKIYCEIIGSGVSSDAYHITAPQPQGEGQLLALGRALSAANLQRVDYVNTHGTGTSKNDAAESMVLHTLFDGAQPNTSVSATKSMTGHCLGATGAMEAALCVLAMQDGAVPPTAGYSDEDLTALRERQGALNFVANKAEPRKLDTVMSNSFAFGGTNASIILSKTPNDAAKDMTKRTYCITGLGTLDGSTELTPEQFAARGVKLGFYRKLDKFSQLQLLAAIDALGDAKLEITPENAPQIASVTGTCDGPMGEILAFQQNVCKNGTASGSAFSFPNTVYNAAGGYLSIFTGLRGYCATLADGAQAGISALCHACAQLDAKQEQACIVSATDEAPESLQDLYARWNPYGAPLGEKSAAVILEPQEQADVRGAKKYAAIAGFACCHTPAAYTDFTPDAALLQKTAQQACADAQIAFGDIDAIFTTFRERDAFTGKPVLCETAPDCRAASSLACVQAAAKAIDEKKYRTALCIATSVGGSCSAVVLRGV